MLFINETAETPYWILSRNSNTYFLMLYLNTFLPSKSSFSNIVNMDRKNSLAYFIFQLTILIHLLI